jgi:hypothetical protein
MFKRTKAVMLPSDKESNIWIGTPELGLRCDKPGYAPFIKYFHLYFLSDEEIKDGDWYYRHNRYGSVIDKCDDKSRFVAKSERYIWENGGKKIISTTDTSLGNRYSGDKDAEKSSLYNLYSLPQPSQSFIEKFVEEYNRGNIITEVLVEYEEILGDEGIIAVALCQTDKRLKVNPKDNTITIRKVKDSWSRLEQTDVIEKYLLMKEPDVFRRTKRSDIKKWIEENL